jgi:hypothetical protein
LEWIPDTTRISVTGSLSRVLDFTSEDTLRIGMEAVRIRASFFGARGVGLVAAAEGLALSSRAANTTAGRAVGSWNLAAAAVRKIPFALEVGFAIVLSDSGGADLGANLGGVVPDAADRVDGAIDFAFVGVLALLDAFASAEFAHGVGAAVKSGLDVVATLAALLGVVVPHALQVGFALAVVGVLVLAASVASTSGGDPFTERIGLAGFLTRSIEFAALTAFVGLRIPSAAHIIRILIETFSLALAEDALAVARTADPDVGLIARTIPFALV